MHVRRTVGGALLLCLLSASSAPAREVLVSRWDHERLELGPRISHLTLTDTETDQALPLGGVGLTVRYRVSRRLGIEATLDVLASDELGVDRPGEVVRVTAPVGASGLFYLFPDWRLQAYFLAGLGVAAHSVEFEALGERVSFATPYAQAGFGLQYRLDSVRLDLSARALLLTRRGDDVQREPLPEGEGGEARPVDYQPFTGDRTLSGALLAFGVHWGL